jgi:DNA polymerase-2
MQVSSEGFILTARHIERHGKTYIECWFVTENGALKAVSNTQQGLFFIHQHDQAEASLLLRESEIEHSYNPLSLKTFEHQAVGGLYFDRNNSLYKAKTLLKQHHICCFEDDIRLTERYFMERFIYGSAAFTGKKVTGKPAELSDMQCKPSQFVPKFSVLSIDIECSENGELFSIGLASNTYKCVLMIGEAQTTHTWIHWLDNEKILLQQFVKQVSTIDPDIIIGWNVVNFDFRLLIKRAALHKVDLLMGRNRC